MTIDLDKLERELLDQYGCSDLEVLANYHGTAHTMLAELRKSQRSIEWLQTLAEKHSLDSARSERELQEAQATIERARAVHQPVKNEGSCVTNPDCPCKQPEIICSCSLHHDDWPDAYPCATVRALDGARD